MKYYITLLFTALLILSCSKSEPPIEYSKPVKYSINMPVKFPDFDITFIGERKVSIPFHGDKEITIIYYDFKVSRDNSVKTVTWTGGTGDIAPQDFEFNGMKFRLELKIFEKEKRKLAEDELVITKM